MKGFYLLLNYVLPIIMALNHDLSSDMICGIDYKTNKMMIFLF